jgi:acyl phosphate:glycerol-3-phosphate acyltransferase
MAWFVLLLGYLLGSIPTAYIAGRIRGKDLRRLGDTNVGAANAFRELGHRIGLAVFVIDAFKGAGAVLLAKFVFQVPELFVLGCGITAVIGHNWPVFLGFRGGRGESTTIGVQFTVVPVAMLILTIPIIATLVLSRNVIITSIWFIAVPIAAWFTTDHSLLLSIYSISLPILVGLTHYFRTRQLAHRHAQT